jgi:ketosteroid isomerase-like protein
MFRQEAEEFIEEGDDVVVLVRMHGRLRGSIQELEDTGGHVWTFRDARVIRFKAFDTSAEALEAAGLSE